MKRNNGRIIDIVSALVCAFEYAGTLHMRFDELTKADPFTLKWILNYVGGDRVVK